MSQRCSPRSVHTSVVYRPPNRGNSITTPGLIYTSGSKLAERGGFAHNDRNVALLVSHPSLPATTVNDLVETRQVAPTILRSLGINLNELQGVRTENTKELNLN